MEQSSRIINKCIGLLEQADDLLKSMDETVFVSTCRISPRGSIGAHLRHVLDFYQCFLAGIESSRVDYDKRERNPKIERDLNSALTRVGSLIEDLGLLSSIDEQEFLLVSAEDDGSGSHFSCNSSVLRELVFLESHTVHHYSLIAMILRLHEIEPPENFGVAPSTLSYWNERAACAR
ncbi:MAG TPA: hypothetical protein VJ124_25105 [Pyrinomonadaceae bacterium]|nr:hypothetical protein [Pyrinomonadaceae bacterium]